MADTSLNIITSDPNSVSITTDDRTITITNEAATTSVTIPQSETSVVQVTSTGAGGYVSASYALTASYATSASYAPDSRPYKVYTALLTQNGGDSPNYGEGTDILYKGRTYQITSNPDNVDISSIGAPNNNPGTYFVCTRAASNEFPDTLGLLSNFGAPVATVLENTIGNVWFNYGSIGNHTITSNQLFTSGKVYNSFTNNNFDDVQTNSAVVSIRATSTSTILIQSGIGGEFSDGLIVNMPIEIRVYN